MIYLYAVTKKKPEIDQQLQATQLVETKPGKIVAKVSGEPKPKIQWWVSCFELVFLLKNSWVTHGDLRSKFLFFIDLEGWKMVNRSPKMITSLLRNLRMVQLHFWSIKWVPLTLDCIPLLPLTKMVKPDPKLLLPVSVDFLKLFILFMYTFLFCNH